MDYLIDYCYENIHIFDPSDERGNIISGLSRYEK